MLRPWLAAALLLVPLAGCSGGPQDDGAPAGPAPSTVTSTGAAPVAPIARTDTMYFLDAPHMAGLLPGGDVLRTYIPNDLDSLDGVTAPEWLVPLTALAAIDSDLRLWIDVQGVVTNPPRGSTCFWTFDFAIAHADGSTTGLTNYCRAADPVLPEGTHLFEFSFLHDLAEVQLRPGDQLSLKIMTLGVYGPDAGLDLVAGTTEFDSSWTIAGLQLPIDTRTLLL